MESHVQGGDDSQATESMFETIFRWNQEWMAMIVKPFTQEGKLMHYVVKLIGGPVILIAKNSVGEWFELKEGTTERAQAVGQAIEYSVL
ncbi:MAG TPA: hypothetical protein VLC28_15795 [Flavitalea sp.]|nr:hypothetical protein [Flavitalea sp.]